MAGDNEKQHGFIIEMSEASNEAMADIPKNRTLLVQQLTNEAPIKPEVTYGLKNITEVFDHFKPNCKISIEDAEGTETSQHLNFKSLGDFSDRGIIAQSETLQTQKSEEVNFKDFERKLRNNKVLQKLLKDEDAKALYLQGLQAMIETLE